MPYSKLKKIQLQKIEALAMVNRKKTSLLKGTTTSAKMPIAQNKW